MKKIILITAFIFIIFSILTIFYFYNKDRFGLTDNRTNIEYFSLDNGLKVLVYTDNKAPVVHHSVWYDNGASDEEIGKSGLAHFLEHAMFKGTQSGDVDFSKIVAHNGGQDNAFTNYDNTTYYQFIPKDKLETIMKLESERMNNLILSDETILNEKNVIVQERLMRVDNEPKRVLAEQMRAALFLNHPYGRPIIGWMEEIKKITPEDVRSWYKKHYSPEKAILILAGDINLKEAKELATKYYGKITPKKDIIKGPRNAVIIKEPNRQTKRVVELQSDRITSPSVTYYYQAPSYNYKNDNKNIYALTILSHLLAGGTNSVLHKELVIDKKLVINVDTYYDDVNLGPSIFTVSADAISDDLRNIEQIINKKIEEIKKGQIDEEQLNITKSLLSKEAIYAKEDLENMAFLIGSIASRNIDIEYLNNWQKNISNITKDDIIKVANEVLKNEYLVVGRLVN